MDTKLSETCRVLFQNKFEKLVHLFGFIITIYVVWQKRNETDFLLTMNFFLFKNQGFPLQNTILVGPLGSYTATEALFSLF